MGGYSPEGQLEMGICPAHGTRWPQGTDRVDSGQWSLPSPLSAEAI